MVPSFAVPMEWTGAVAGCNAGDTSAAYKAAVARTVNSFRVLAGLPGNITLNDSLSVKAQKSALMMQANNALSHEPPTNWLCYTADGATAAGKSNLALGNAGPNAVHAYVSDRGVESLGHRRWVLYSRLVEVGTGDTARANTLWVIGATGTAPPSATTAGVPWPPRGYVPWAPRVADPTDPWSISIPGANFSGASVTMSNDQGQVLSVANVKALPNGYGDNTLSWSMTAPVSQWSRSPQDTKFTVVVNNVTVNNLLKTYEYSVTFVRP